MRIREIIVPELQRKKINNAIINKEELYYNAENISLFICKDGIYSYKLNSDNDNANTFHKIIIDVIGSYRMIKRDNIYERINEECESENIIYINEYNQTNKDTNIIPFSHEVISFKRYTIMSNSKSPVSLVVEEYTNNIPNKVIFLIRDDHSINSQIIKDDLNKLISFLI